MKTTGEKILAQSRQGAETRRSSPVFNTSLASWRLHVPFENPNGIPALSTAVARHELPWVIFQSKKHQPQGGCDQDRRVRATTPLGLISISDSPPSVAPSFVVATLG